MEKIDALLNKNIQKYLMTANPFQNHDLIMKIVST